MTNTRHPKVIQRGLEDLLDHAQRDDTTELARRFETQLASDIPANVKNVTASRLRRFGGLLRRLGLAAVIDEQDGWPTAYRGAAYEWAGLLAKQLILPGAEKPIAFVNAEEGRAALTAMAFGEFETAFALVDKLVLQIDRRMEHVPTCHLVALLKARLEQQPSGEDWPRVDELYGYRAIYEALDAPEQWMSACRDACDEHLRLMGMKDGDYLDFYADPVPVDIVAMSRAFEHLHGEAPPMPEHPLLATPVASIPSVVERPELRDTLDEMLAGFVRGAFESELFVCIPGSRAASDRWPSPAPPWAGIANKGHA